MTVLRSPRVIRMSIAVILKLILLRELMVSNKQIAARVIT
jgi:hypothetical protein